MADHDSRRSAALTPPFVPGAPRRETPIPPITDYAYESQDAARPQNAAEAWADLDWDAEAGERGRARRDHVAARLEEIVRRIRSGELVVPGQPGMSAEAAAAAVLTALLIERR